MKLKSNDLDDLGGFSTQTQNSWKVSYSTA